MLERLKRRAKRHGLTIRPYCGYCGEGFFMLVDVERNFVAAPAPMTLEQISMWLDDLDEQADE